MIHSVLWNNICKNFFIKKIKTHEKLTIWSLIYNVWSTRSFFIFLVFICSAFATGCFVVYNPKKLVFCLIFSSIVVIFLLRTAVRALVFIAERALIKRKRPCLFHCGEINCKRAKLHFQSSVVQSPIANLSPLSPLPTTTNTTFYHQVFGFPSLFLNLSGYFDVFTGIC